MIVCAVVFTLPCWSRPCAYDIVRIIADIRYPPSYGPTFLFRGYETSPVRGRVSYGFPYQFHTFIRKLTFHTRVSYLMLTSWFHTRFHTGFIPLISYPGFIPRFHTAFIPHRKTGRFHIRIKIFSHICAL